MSRYVYWQVVRMDTHETLATHYWTGQGWTTHARQMAHRDQDGFTHPSLRPINFTSLKEARQHIKDHIPRPLPPRTTIWATGSRARQTMFHP